MILAIDQGTTGTRSFVFDERGEPVGRAYREHAQHFPRPGWVEHDAAEIWSVAHAVAGEALADARVRAGPDHRRAAAQRDRLAGPAHGRTLRRAARRRARAARARAHGPGARPVLQRHQVPVAARARRRPARASAAGTRAARDDRLVA